jgi:inositol-1,3,4-trisphosphate 5/6-kinase/inositol-tetrakisphosphate 1-kinase
MERGTSWEAISAMDGADREPLDLPSREYSFTFGIPPKQSKRSKSSLSSISALCGGDSDDENWVGVSSVLVGYAFGRKKMSTMSIIMAEASEVAEENSWDEPTLLSSCSNSLMATSSKEINSSVLRPMEVDGSLRAAVSKHPFRISFVPVDLNFPLEEQHGGNFDAILHKLTEDILLSLPETKFIQLRNQFGNGDNQRIDQESAELVHMREQAAARLHRLERYKEEHPCCCLVDPPEKIKVVLCRADIANVLSKCLVGVTTTSGIPVATPKFFVSYESNVTRLATELGERSFRFPIISKPFTAAGSPESHKMVIFLNSNGLKEIQSPCLLQEYANHDAILHKVYVLGDDVYVFQRSSLPNLPVGNNDNEEINYVAFDSQAPYPKLSVFRPNDSTALTDGEPDTAQGDHQKQENTHCTECSSVVTHFVDADELKPVASALQRAFCLGLFGFDVIVSRERGWPEMFVIDVNYFPSYKEVENFPFLLTQYLARSAVNNRCQGAEVRLGAVSM